MFSFPAQASHDEAAQSLQRSPEFFQSTATRRYWDDDLHRTVVFTGQFKARRDFVAYRDRESGTTGANCATFMRVRNEQLFGDDNQLTIEAWNNLRDNC